MTSEEIVQEWVDRHNELVLDGHSIMQGDKSLGRFRDGNVTIGPDGGVSGEPVEVDDEWLIVEGRRVAYAGEPRDAKKQAQEDPNAQHLHGGLIEWQGKFAVQPWQPRQPEIDGPIPE